MSDSTVPVKGLRAWLFAMRPWSFTAAAAPILFGAGLAALEGSCNPWLFALTMLGGLAMQAATNFHNTYGDYMSGVDTPASAATCPQLVTGIFRPEAMYLAGWLALACAVLIGLILAWASGPLILLFGIVGALGSYWYTNGKRPYKYMGLGPLFVFLLMGPLMALPAYFIQTDRLTMAPVFGSLGIACLVAAILHANDMRDIAHDCAAGIRTLAMMLGLRRAIHLFTGLTLGAFGLLALSCAGGLLPWTCLAAFILLPKLGSKLRRIQARDYDFVDLEGWTAKFHFQFGLLLVAGLAAARLSA